MAANLPALDQMPGARAGEYPQDHHFMDSSEAISALRAAQAVYESPMRQNPQEVLDLSHYSQNWPVTDHGDYGISEDTAGRHEHQKNAGSSSLGNDHQHILLTFPEGEGEVDAVTITEQDVEGLQPTKFLSNNIIDFYIKYLERRLPSEDRNRFHFFNTFFFTKLLGNSCGSTNIDQCEVDYEPVRKWTGEVNLFEKDYVFIPVFRSSHWSLLIICNLSSLWSSADKRKGSPCVLHLDAVEGKHESFEDHVRSYILQAWMKRYQDTNYMDQLLALCQMKYVRAKVPQQDNSYDCGLYLLHFVEVFLREYNSLDFSFASSKGGPHFTSPSFAGEVSAKRMAILELIYKISRTSQEQAAERVNIANLSHELRRICQKLLTCSEGEAISGGDIDDVQGNGVSMFDAQGDEGKHVVHLSSGEFAGDNQHLLCLTETGHTDHRTTWESALDTNRPDGVEVAHAEYQSTTEVAADKQQQPKILPCTVLPKSSKETNKRKWKEEETSILLNCKVEGGRFCKGNQAATRWDIISQEIKNNLGTMPSADQCRLRYDTLLKAYKTIKKHCSKTGKPFSEITEKERRELRLATTLRAEWYEVIDGICRWWPHKTKSPKRVKLSPSDGDGLVSVSPSNPAPPSPPAPASPPVPAPISAPAPIPSGNSKPENSLQRQVVVSGFWTLDDDLKFTLLNLIQASPMKDWSNDSERWKFEYGTDRGNFSELEVICQRLAIVQDRKPSDIRRFVLKLSELKLVTIEFKMKKIVSDVFFEELPCLNFFNLRVYKKFIEKVLCKNPHLKTYLQIRDNYDSVSFPRAPLSSSLQRIRVLSLYDCQQLEHVDLSNFPELRSLDISRCEEMKAITGWEAVKELEWLMIRACHSYGDFPRVQCLPSLRVFRFDIREGWLAVEITSVSDFSQCVGLRRLEIMACITFSALNSMSLSTLRFLEVLKLVNCTVLKTIEGLSRLHFLTQLDLRGCRALRRVPELDSLKALTHLDMSWSGVEEIPGVQKLHLLTSLVLFYCFSLTTLPCLGHLKALAYLGIRWSGVEEIPGVEDLVSLETLDCDESRLKCLPDLHHLPRLRKVWVGETPLSTTDPSSFYYGKRALYFNSQEERMGFVDDISDVSDTE